LAWKESSGSSELRFHGYLTQAQRNLIDLYLQKKIVAAPKEGVTVLASWSFRSRRLGLGSELFTAPRGGFLMNLNRVWYRAIKRARLDGLHFHDLRHAFASRLAMSGVDLFRAQTLMGHNSSRMTIRCAHLSPEQARTCGISKIVRM
jgi:integrase